MARRSAKCIVLDDQGRILLFKGVSASGDVLAWWFCPGGGLEAGEGYEQAARRELFEETGIVADELGPVVLERTVRLTWDGVEFDQTEHYFVVRTSMREISSDLWTEEERQVIVEHRWWTVDELRSADEPVFPEELIRLLESLSL